MSKRNGKAWDLRATTLWLRSAAGAVVAALILQGMLGYQAGAAPLPGAGGEGFEAAAPATPGTRGDGANLEDRLRRLEELGTAFEEQNRRLTEQNERMAQQNQELTRQLQNMSRRYEELSHRLNRVSVTAPAQAPAQSQGPSAASSPNLDRQTIQTAEMMNGPGSESSFFSSLSPENTGSADLPAQNPWPMPPSPTLDSPFQDAESRGSPFRIGGYDKEKNQFILVQPKDSDHTPFALNFDLITELRYTGFSRSAQTWTDSAGTVLPVRNYDTIEVNRNWFQFSGYALDPRLRYMAVVFSSSTNNATLFLGWVDYRFNRAITLSGGYYKVPGSREWVDSFRYTLGADRTMATTFFRPSMSPGFWVSGEPVDNLHYIAMVANSFNGLELAGNRIGSSMAFSGSLWWEPLGKFGPGPSDIEWHKRPALRIGSSLTASREPLPGPTAVQTNPENTLFRLSDGTPLSLVGSLSPSVQVETTSVRLWAIDAAFKYRGLGLSGEYYFRWLDDFRHSGGSLPIRSLFDNGAYAQASYFVIPSRLEGYARYSFVTGQFGGGDEWSGGCNWYVQGTRHWRTTFDVTQINHSPAQNLLTGYRAGESGTLFQLQMLVDF